VLIWPYLMFRLTWYKIFFEKYFFFHIYIYIYIYFVFGVVENNSQTENIFNLTKKKKKKKNLFSFEKWFTFFNSVNYFSSLSFSFSSRLIIVTPPPKQTRATARSPPNHLGSSLIHPRTTAGLPPDCHRATSGPLLSHPKPSWNYPWTITELPWTTPKPP
jgi:hypothetical protein